MRRRITGTEHPITTHIKSPSSTHCGPILIASLSETEILLYLNLGVVSQISLSGLRNTNPSASSSSASISAYNVSSSSIFITEANSVKDVLLFERTSKEPLLLEPEADNMKDSAALSETTQLMSCNPSCITCFLLEDQADHGLALFCSNIVVWSHHCTLVWSIVEEVARVVRQSHFSHCPTCKLRQLSLQDSTVSAARSGRKLCSVLMCATKFGTECYDWLIQQCRAVQWLDIEPDSVFHH